MIAVKLERDEARALQKYFFFYLQQLCIYRMKEATTEKDKMLQLIISDIFNQVQQLFYKKLMNKSNTLLFKFDDSQAIVLYEMLFNFPIDAKEIYLLRLRQMFCDILYQPIMETINLAEIKSRQPVETG